MRRCLKGRIVACIRSNEIAAMFVREVRGNQRWRKVIITINSRLKFIFVMSHVSERCWNRRKWENPPTNISATVRFITRYMARVRRLRFFKKRTIDIRFTVTIAAATVINTANQVMHSDEENCMTCFLLLLLFASHFFSRRWTNKVDVCFSKISNEDTWIIIIPRIRKLTFNLQFFKLPSKKMKWKSLFSPVEKISVTFEARYIWINWLTKSWGH